MTTYLLTWNPDGGYPWNEIQDEAERLNANGNLRAAWSFGNRTHAEPGERFFMIKQGRLLPKGIMAAGRLVSQPYEAEHWRNPKEIGIHVDVEFDSILIPGEDKILDRKMLNAPEFSDMYWGSLNLPGR